MPHRVVHLDRDGFDRRAEDGIRGQRYRFQGRRRRHQLHQDGRIFRTDDRSIADAEQPLKSDPKVPEGGQNTVDQVRYADLDREEKPARTEVRDQIVCAAHWTVLDGLFYSTGRFGGVK